MNFLPDKQMFFNNPFQLTNCRKEEMCVDNKVGVTFGDVYCPTWRNEKCVYISTNKTTSFYDCKKSKACCNVLNFPFKDQKPTNVTVLLVLQESRVATTKKKTIYIFGEISPPITTKHSRTWTKKGRSYSIYGMIVSTPHWLMQLTKCSFTLWFSTFSV